MKLSPKGIDRHLCYNNEVFIFNHYFMNQAKVKKVLLIILVLGVVLTLANWQMKRGEKSTSPTSTTPPAKPEIFDKLKNKVSPPAPKPAPAPAPSPVPISATPNIEAIYQNKVVPPSLTRYHRYQINIPAGGYVQKLIVAVPASFDFQTLTRADRAALNQATWKDNNYNYISTDNPTGSYLTELTTPAEVDMQYSCSSKNRVATCVIQPVK